ncbi:hypothetical protein [Nocardia sp. NBC_01009]|uniref:hypothetical protein n=1 Tax=Nocardia sp. NBC_01009 TaxID=2975996 RepID=UPI003869BCE5|nr:hypothetical protein OHA42_23715 [Nocardia sp. NBC_01009]
MYTNFTSHADRAWPVDNAAAVMPRVVCYLVERRTERAHLGIIPMDFPHRYPKVLELLLEWNFSSQVLIQLPLPPSDPPPRPPRSVVVGGLVAVGGCGSVVRGGDWVVGGAVDGAVVTGAVGLGAFRGSADPHPVASSDAATAAGSAYATRRDIRRPPASKFPDDLPRKDFPLATDRTDRS